MQNEEIRITGNDVSCAAAQSEFEEFIVFWIAASCNPYLRVIPFGLAREGRKKTSNIFLIDVPAELFPIEDFVELGKRSK